MTAKLAKTKHTKDTVIGYVQHDQQWHEKANILHNYYHGYVQHDQQWHESANILHNYYHD
jgi:hypothetical protein